MTHYYIFYCGDDDQIILGDHALDVRDSAEGALAAMTDDELLADRDIWFAAFIDRVCKMNGFKPVKTTNGLHIESLHRRECERREE